MIDEGFIRIKFRRHGPAAFLRRKQWWSFEGLDPDHGVYFVFLAMQSFPSGYVSITAMDLNSGRRTAEDHLVGVQALPGDRVDVSAQGKWGRVRFLGKAEENWRIEVETDSIKALVNQTARCDMHRNRLLTKHIDYSLLQSVHNDMQGALSCDGRDLTLSGWGYCEHAWGVQARHSTANWLHFWAPNGAGVVMDCRYDAGIQHNYTYLWADSKNHYLYSPAHFSFNPDSPLAEWKISSPDLELDVSPICAHRMVKRIPPLLPYIDIDYHELLVKLSGAAMVRGVEIPIQGFGKYDYNFNKW